MDELIALVSQKTGLSEEMSKRAVEIVLEYLKKKLPAPIAGRIDDVLGGGEALGGLGNLAEGLGGLLGKK
ncbi:MAG TPA: hypothetical protein ENN99_01445 [Chloroflexi bacterium]|nr:hypothetical protein [Chloroflexota bacterium]